MRKSKIFDASGNSLVKPGKKSVNRKTYTNDHCDNKRKSTDSEVTPIPCSEEADITETVGSKPLLRRPTFKEFEGKFRNAKGARLLKSQSLDEEPVQRPVTPGTKPSLEPVKELPKTGLKGLSRRAREVFWNQHPTGKTPDSCHQPEVISSKQSFMGRFFQK